MIQLTFERKDYPNVPILKERRYTRSLELVRFDKINQLFPDLRDIFVEDALYTIYSINYTYPLDIYGNMTRGAGPIVLVNLVAPWSNCFVVPENYCENLRIWAPIAPGRHRFPVAE